MLIFSFDTLTILVAYICTERPLFTSDVHHMWYTPMNHCSQLPNYASAIFNSYFTIISTYVIDEALQITVLILLQLMALRSFVILFYFVVLFILFPHSSVPCSVSPNSARSCFCKPTSNVPTRRGVLWV